MNQTNNQNDPNLNISSICKQPGNNLSIPSFFVNRSLGWFALALGIPIATLIAMHTFVVYLGLLTASLILAGVCLYQGIRLLRIGKKGRYFTMRMTCVAIRQSTIRETVPNYFNPVSNTAFRSTQQVTFETKTGTQLIYSYEKSRKFLVGAQYDFYYHMTTEPLDKMTSETLEQLRIDHAIVSQPLQANDFSGSVTPSTSFEPVQDKQPPTT